MTSFVITAPDGKRYKVSGSGTKEEALAEFQKQWKPQDAAPSAKDQEQTALKDKLYPPGSWGRTFSDLTDVSMDTVTRGFGSKLFGDQARVEQARENLPASAELAADIPSTIVSMPYRGAGAVTGALEGVANAYGHQKNWVPGMSDLGDMATQGAEGGVLGWLGGRLGNMVGKKLAQREAKAAQPYKTDAEFLAANKRAQEEVSDTASKLDYGKRAERLNAARAAQGGSKDAFATMMAGMDMPAGEKAIVDKLTKPSMLRTAASAVDEFAPKKFSLPALAAETIAFGGVPWMTLKGLAAKKGLNMAANATDKVGRVDDLAAMIRDPSGRGLALDPAISARWRDAFAKAGVGLGR